MRATGIGGEYVPIDVSASFLNDTATRLRRDYPGLAVTPVVADIAEELTSPDPSLIRPCTPFSAAPSETSILRPPSGCSAGYAQP